MTNVRVGSVVLKVNSKRTRLESTTINKLFKSGCFLEIFLWFKKTEFLKPIYLKEKKNKAIAIFVTALSLMIN